MRVNLRYALLTWFDGRVLCKESRRHIQNFMVVAQARPEAVDADDNNDENISDDELFLDEADLHDALRTASGPRDLNCEIGGEAQCGLGTTAEQGMVLGRSVWPLAEMANEVNDGPANMPKSRQHQEALPGTMLIISV